MSEVGSRVPDYVGTWWQSRSFKRRIQLIGRVGTDRFVAHHQRPKGGSKTYRVTLYTLQGEYRQIPPPKERKKPPPGARSGSREGVSLFYAA